MTREDKDGFIWSKERSCPYCKIDFASNEWARGYKKSGKLVICQNCKNYYEIIRQKKYEQDNPFGV